VLGEVQDFDLIPFCEEEGIGLILHRFGGDQGDEPAQPPRPYANSI